MTAPRKKLIEVALPLEAINEEGSRRKRKAPAGYPTTLHKWWAQRPVAAARAVVFAQMVDDPSSHPDLFPTEKKQEQERKRLFRIIEDLIRWENTADDRVIQAARDEVQQSWRFACADYVDHPLARELFDREKLPIFHDPFAGSGALPLEAQRLGLEVYSTDLNPVAVLINTAMIDLPARFAAKPPVNPNPRQRLSPGEAWRRAKGLAEDVRFYGRWASEEAKKRIGHLYPTIELTSELVSARPELKKLKGKKLGVVAWLWARTVRSPNPAFSNVEVPLATTFMLSTNEGRQAYAEPTVEGNRYWFSVKVGKPGSPTMRTGTKLPGAANFRCMMSGEPISVDYIRAEGKAGRIGARLMAIVAEGERGRVYLSPTRDMESLALSAKPTWAPELEFFQQALGFRVGSYGMTRWSDLFTHRQLVALTTLSDVTQEVIGRVERDALASGLAGDGTALSAGGTGAKAYAEAIGTYLAFAVSRAADYGSALATWRPKDSAMRSTLAKQTVQMTWDFAEGSPFGDSSAGFVACTEVVAKVLETALGDGPQGHALQVDAAQPSGVPAPPVISTDPPYFDNVGYADLSDFYYVWLRRSLRSVFPALFATVAVPKSEELVATPARHGGKGNAETFFLSGMTAAMRRLAERAHPAFPVTIYYAFKQAEEDDEKGTVSTGWETFLEAVIRSGFSLSGTWPMRTEGDNRMRGLNSNALASSIVLVCRPRPAGANAATRRDFIAALRAELPAALLHLQRGNIAPVDLAQAAIGPGMAVYTRFSSVLDAGGQPLSVRDALALINQVLDESLAKQEGDFDADSRWALAWFEQIGFADGEYGVAEMLSKAKNTSVKGLEDAGILKSSRGKVRLLKPAELSAEWDPTTDDRLTAWEVVHHLIRALDAGGELGAAAVVAKLGTKAEAARELAYRLYTLCERKKRATEALAYNGLVQSWPEITRLAREGGKARPATQGTLFDRDEE